MCQGYWMTPKIENKDFNYIYFSNQIKVRKLPEIPRACKSKAKYETLRWTAVKCGFFRFDPSFILPPSSSVPLVFRDLVRLGAAHSLVTPLY